jgi:hypothetical protein
MRRVFIFVAVLAVAVGVTAGPASAGSGAHFKKPAPTFTKNSDLSVTGTGTLAGLGNGDIKVVINATGSGTATCTNPGGNDAPGQNPVSVNVSGGTTIPANKITNGSVGFSVTSDAPANPTPAEAGCPNSSWRVTGLSVSYTSVTLTVFQDSNGQNGIFDAPGTQILQQTFAVSL